MQKQSAARALGVLAIAIAFTGCAHESPPNVPADGGGVFDPVPEDKYGINVESEPSGGHITCRDLRNGEELVGEGDNLKTPGQLLMPRPSDYRVTVTLAGRMPATRDVMEGELILGDAVPVDLELVPMPDGCCTVSVASNPQGHAIYADGVDPSTVTPATIMQDPGTHRILVANPGFRGWIWEGAVSNGLSITLPVGRDLEGTWNPEGDTPGGVVEITMESTADKILAHGSGIGDFTVVGDSISYDDGTLWVDGQVEDNGNVLAYVLHDRTDASWSQPYRYRKQ